MPLGLSFELTGVAGAGTHIVGRPFTLWDIMPQKPANFEGRIFVVATRSVPANNKGVRYSLQVRIVDGEQASAWADLLTLVIDGRNRTMRNDDTGNVPLNAQYRFQATTEGGWAAGDVGTIAISV